LLYRNKPIVRALSPTRSSKLRGYKMPRLRVHDRPGWRPPASAGVRREYFVLRQEDFWFITFDGKSYGPYQTEREALLFAIDAAKKLVEQGESTAVLVVNEDGIPQTAWTDGQDHPYPPR